MELKKFGRKADVFIGICRSLCSKVSMRTDLATGTRLTADLEDFLVDVLVVVRVLEKVR